LIISSNFVKISNINLDGGLEKGGENIDKKTARQTSFPGAPGGLFLNSVH